MMKTGAWLGIVVLSVGLGGCGGKKKGEGETKKEPSGETAAKPAGGDPAGGVKGAGGSAANAAGGAVAAGETVTECPKSLGGGDEVNRVITKACGVVIVTEDLAISGTLTLEAGATLAFQEGAGISVGYYKPSKIIVKGTAQEPVTFTVAPGVDKVPGVWVGLRLYEQAARSSIEGLVIEYAGKDQERYGAVWIAAQDVTLKGSTIRESKGVGVFIDSSVKLADFSGNTFEKVGKVAVVANPVAAGQIAPTNKFPAETTIKISGGAIASDTKWAIAGTPYWITDTVHVDAEDSRPTLEIVAGAEVRFSPDAALSAGYYSKGMIKAVGTPDAPIRFTSADLKEPGAWAGLAVYGGGELHLEHALVEFAGGDENHGALFVDGAQVTVKGCSFQSNRAGVVFRTDEAKIRTFDGNKFGPSDKPAISLTAALFGFLGPANTYDAKATIELRGGTVTEPSTWHTQPTTVAITENVSLDDVVSIGPGAQFVAGAGTAISVGYNHNASLRAQGTADKPIVFRCERDEPGCWEGIKLYGQSKSSVIEHVKIEGAGGDAGLEIEGAATAKVTELVCEKCEGAAVNWDCASKVETTGIKAAGGTPKGEAKPEGCP